MTFSTSIVAACCSIRSPYSLLRCASAVVRSSSARYVSTGDRDDRLLGEGFQQFDLTVGEAAGVIGGKRDGADRLTVAHQWNRYL